MVYVAKWSYNGTLEYSNDLTEKSEQCHFLISHIRSIFITCVTSLYKKQTRNKNSMLILLEIATYDARSVAGYKIVYKHKKISLSSNRVLKEV